MIQIRQSFTENKPTLYFVSTPIGNLKDITFRAIEILENVDLIYAEDTRVTKKLLNHYNINKQVNSYHSFNEEEKSKEILANLENGLSIAFCTDAGTPGISDPGYFLVKKIKNYFPVVSIPGVSAVLAGIVTSGLVPQPFTFIGFTERKSGKRIKQLNEYKKYQHTLIFYERFDRIIPLVSDLFEVFGKRQCVLARELTKMYETFVEFELGTDISNLEFRGEYVVMISGYVEREPSTNDILQTAKEFLEKGYTKKDAINLTSDKLNVNKNIVYDLVIKRNLGEE